MQKKKSKKRTVKSDQKCFGNFWLPVPRCKKKKALKSDQNFFSGQKKKNRKKKKALKSDQNVFRTFCSAPDPPHEDIKFLTVKSDAIFSQKFSVTFYC